MARAQRSTSQLGSLALVALLVWQCSDLIASFCVAPSGRGSLTSRRASVVDTLENPVKTVSASIDGFYKEYPQPPVLPMYRSFLIDFITQTHLSLNDARFKYDGIFALGMWTYYTGLMGSYDKMVNSPESDKIWSALVSALGMQPEKVKEDAEAVISYAETTSPADILQHLEGSSKPSAAVVSEAFESIRSSLYSSSFSVGLFRIMELSGVEVKKTNVEEWAKALKIEPASKVTADLDTYLQNKDKLQKAEEMMREIEIREKKKLAERLEQKAKALAEKAAAKTEDASKE
eukprot:TRINITY_DN1968_c0_g1_i1.p1 TRINITY_DN1968_c0_g1~~TRINITY_DN1968_c0_g1_i1.p1  ORF type:complete len:315 (-),score=92.26 TRINITY_DN1968_c0_g1_i1:271-1140(-)